MPTGSPFTVMTRSLYVGSEFEPVMSAGSLQEVLERRGLRYVVVEQVWNIDASMPSGFPAAARIHD